MLSTLPTYGPLATWGALIGMAMLIGGIVANRLSGGKWIDLPFYYDPPAVYLYFGGIGVFLAGYGLAQILG